MTTEKKYPRTLVLFDIDGTLTRPRQPITDGMENFVKNLTKIVDVGLIGGSDIEKIAQQMTTINDQLKNVDEQIARLIKNFKFIFAENGLIAYENGQLIGKESILNELGEERIQKFINFTLEYLSRLVIPKKRGNFIEFRNGLINVSPIGRSCTHDERLEFYKYDQLHEIRKKMINDFNEKFENTDINLDYVIGGQISIDCFPRGWDKRYCLKFISNEIYDKIYFFGDRCLPGGNDYALFSHERTVGHSVMDPEDTKHQVEKLFLL